MKLEEAIKTKKFSSPFQRATLNVAYTSNWLSEKWNEIFKAYDISEPQYNVLRILRGQQGNPINLVDIQGRMIQKNSNTTRLVEKLKLKGLVERIICEKNRRKVEITITENGMHLLEEIDPIIRRNEGKIFKNLSANEAKQLGDLLDKLRGYIKTS